MVIKKLKSVFMNEKPSLESTPKVLTAEGWKRLYGKPKKEKR